MQIPDDAVLLRIFIGEAQRYEHAPLFEAIVKKARETGMAGATVLRGPLSYGQTSHMHTEMILRLSADLPIVIELVDSPDKIDKFAAIVGPMIGSGLITLQNVRVLRYGSATQS
jgi:PII-like signaling protein